MKLISDLFNKTIIYNTNLISEVILTNDSVAKVEFSEIKKIDNKVAKFNNEKIYNLSKFSCNLNDIEATIENEVFNKIKTCQFSQQIEFNPKGYFKFIKRKKIENLLEKSQNYNWCLCNQKISNLFDEKKIFCIIDNTLSDEVYFGQSDSLSVILSNKYYIKNEIINFELLIDYKNIIRIILE